MHSYELSLDPNRVQVDIVHAALAASYWSPDVRHDILEKAIAHSIVISAFAGDTQVGFARVVTDSATFAWLCDVWVGEAHRGAGLGKQMVAALIAHPPLQTLRRWALATKDAHGLYAQFGFTPVPEERWMQKVLPVERWQRA